MAIRLKCDGCGKTMQAPDHAAGKRVKCKACQQTTLVPARNQREPSPADGPPKRRRRTRSPHEDDFDDPSPESQRAARPLFKCRYGALPKLMLYGGVPFLLVVAIVLFIASVYYGFALKIRGMPIPSWAVAYILSPLLLLLPVLSCYQEFYQRRHPRYVIATRTELLAPSSPVSRKQLKIRWNGMTYTIHSLIGIEQVTLKNSKQTGTVRLASPLFATRADYERFLEVVESRAEPA